jgi:hypothetical protein
VGIARLAWAVEIQELRARRSQAGRAARGVHVSCRLAAGLAVRTQAPASADV